jgi:hypothetical protein
MVASRISVVPLSAPPCPSPQQRQNRYGILGSEAFHFRDVALLINQVSSDGHTPPCLPPDRVSIGSGNAKRIWQTMDFFSYFGRRKNCSQKGVPMTIRILLVVGLVSARSLDMAG